MKLMIGKVHVNVGLTRMDPGILGNAICKPCCGTRDVGAMAIAVCAWRQPIQREALPHSCALAISCQKLLMLSVDALQGCVAHHYHRIQTLAEGDLPVTYAWECWWHYFQGMLQRSRVLSVNISGAGDVVCHRVYDIDMDATAISVIAVSEVPDW